MTFTPLDILFLVLAFCALWLTAATFWLVWQAGNVLRNVNDTLETAQEKMARIESAITAIRSRFEHITSASTMLMEGLKRVMEFVGEKREAMAEHRAAPKRRATKRVVGDDELDDEA